ncbi:MAG TPA: hypothetical protein VKV17_03985 [Bryobacteraceae bacterium]|nr:hypothetical protein [Bryobacteraceae bacterium]
MALGQIGKQLAAQALKAPVKDVLDSLRSGDAAQAADAAKSARPAAAPGENLAATILAQVQAMQKALKEDEELLVLLFNGLETMRVVEIYAPSWSVAVLTGFDTERNLTRVISPIENLQLICKVMKAAPGAKPVKVNLIAPRPAAP